MRLAMVGGGPSARDLAEFEQLPTAFVRKLMTLLGAAGVVSASEGPTGGWRFAKAPGEVSVLAVVEAVSAAGPLFDCRNVRARCALWAGGEAPARALRGVFAIHAVMLQAEQAMRSVLAATTVADLVAQVRAKTSPGFATATALRFGARRPQRSARKAVP